MLHKNDGRLGSREARAGRRRALIGSLACCAVLAGAPAAAAEWEFTPRVSAGGTWTDNVTAADSGFEESEFITELSPGFNLGLNGPRAEMSLDYSAQALWYQDNSDFDDVYHNLFGDAVFTLMPDKFFLDAFARLDQENIDPAGRVTTGNFFQTGNRTDATLYGISPWYQDRFGDWAETLLRYRYQGVNYSDTDPTDLRVQDSDTHSANARLGSPEGRPGLSWGANVSYTLTEFDNDQEFEYGQAALDLGYAVGSRSRVTFTIGSESDVETDPTKGGFDETFWYVGYAWQPSQRQSLSARVGDRYYGTAFEFRWTRQGTRGELSVDYTETPTTANQRLFDGEGTFSGGRPGAPALDTGVFLSKRLTARATYKLVRTRLNASVYAEDRERQSSSVDPVLLRDDEVWGVRLGADWDAAARTQVNFSTRYEDRESDGGRNSDLLELSVSARRDITRTFYGQLRASHATRDFDNSGYDINAVTLSLGAEF